MTFSLRVLITGSFGHIFNRGDDPGSANGNVFRG